MAYFIYVRKSQEDEGRQIQSIDDQIKLAKQLANELGLEVVECLEEAMSAKRPGRPVFNRMLERIRQGEAEGIIAWHPDRLSRNAVDAGQLIDLLDTGGIVELKFHSYRFENTPEGKWMLQIVLSQSKYFVDKLSKDVNRGMQSKVEKGHFPGRALPGYRNDIVDRTIVEDPERFAMLRRAIDLLLTGAYTVSQVLELLNGEWGFRTRRTKKTGGAPLTRSVFYRMVSNPFYAGHILYHGELWPGKHKPMMTQFEFDRLQTLIHRNNLVVQPRKHEFAFSGFIRCGICGCRVTADSKVKHYKTTGNMRTYVYYHCSNGRGGCRKVGTTEAEIEQHISDLLARVEIDPTIRDWCLAPAQRWFQQETGREHQALDAQLKALAVAERKKTTLIDDRLLDPGLYTIEEFKQQKERLQVEINDIRKAIKSAEDKLERDRQTVENIFDFAVNAPTAFRQGDIKMRKEIALQLGAKYYLTLGKLHIEPHPLLVPILTFGPLNNGSDSPQGGSRVPVNPTWYSVRDAILTLVSEGDYYFPRLHYGICE